MTKASRDSLVAWKNNGLGFLKRLARRRAVRTLSRHRGKLGVPMIACIPGDNIGDSVIANGWYEDSLLFAIFEGLLAGRREHFASGLALDVGANIGNHTLWFSKIFSRVVAFEPNPICYRLLEANLLLNEVGNVVPMPSGLSDHPGRTAFYMNRGGNIGNSGVNSGYVKDAGATFDVDLVVGDDVLTKEILGGLAVDLLKIDVEGHELAALRGLSRILRDHQPIVLFESHGAKGSAGSDEVVRFLTHHGLDRFYVIERDRPSHRNVWLRAIRRVVKGERLIVRKVDRPEDRPYGLVVASSLDLLPA